MAGLKVSLEELEKRSQDQEKDKTYNFTAELRCAVEIALLLEQPLLVVGEPGTGKTQLAKEIAKLMASDESLNFFDRPYVYNAKSNSTYSEMFYSYDAIGHFYKAHIPQPSVKGDSVQKTDPINIQDFIELNALGKAIVASLEAKEQDKLKVRNKKEISAKKNSVVLIDEIDKAPRDFPNDLLDAIEFYQFKIKEISEIPIKIADDAKILIIITSNGERDLPDAFLRRCIFFEIEFPQKDVLKKILDCHFDHLELDTNQLISLFEELREICKNKKPATAELIKWYKYLAHLSAKGGSNKINLKNRSTLLDTLSIVVKNEDDMKQVKAKWASENK